MIEVPAISRVTNHYITLLTSQNRLTPSFIIPSIVERLPPGHSRDVCPIKMQELRLLFPLRTSLCCAIGVNSSQVFRFPSCTCHVTGAMWGKVLSGAFRQLRQLRG
ncbi:hypothetical protein HZ326_23761 [Fusarium oxysporum f. sp. albedinis]|nr:hypothetical protein HZ326_23761 [Fusarium oxysporum f. sp. albedinis]